MVRAAGDRKPKTGTAVASAVGQSSRKPKNCTARVRGRAPFVLGRTEGVKEFERCSKRRPQPVAAGWGRTLWRQGLVLAAALVIGLLAGHPWVALALAALGIAAWQQLRLRRLLLRLQSRRHLPAAQGAGAWNELDDVNLSSLIWAGSLFVGADTPLGPFYLGAGLTDDSNASLYLLLGKLF